MAATRQTCNLLKKLTSKMCCIPTGQYDMPLLVEVSLYRVDDLLTCRYHGNIVSP